jgi:hypothetical protein
VAAGAAMFAVAIPINLGAADRYAWTSADRYSTLSGYRDYVDAFPRGKHITEAREKIAGLYDRAIEQYSARAGSNTAGAKAIVSVLQALKASDGRSVNVSYESSIDFSAVKGFNERGITDAEPAFTTSENKSRERAITTAMRDAFARVVGNDIIDFDDGGNRYSYDYVNHRQREKKEGPVTFAIKYRVGPSGTVYESTTGSKKKFYGILFEWQLAIKDDKGGELYKTQLSSAPAKNIRYTSYGYVQSDILPYTKMAESAFDEFGRKLAGDFGVSIAKPTGADYAGGDDDAPPPTSQFGRPPPRGNHGVPTPSLNKALMDVYNNPNTSEATKKMLLDMMKRNEAR